MHLDLISSLFWTIAIAAYLFAGLPGWLEPKSRLDFGTALQVAVVGMTLLIWVRFSRLAWVSHSRGTAIYVALGVLLPGFFLGVALLKGSSIPKPERFALSGLLAAVVAAVSFGFFGFGLTFYQHDSRVLVQLLLMVMASLLVGITAAYFRATAVPTYKVIEEPASKPAVENIADIPY